MTDMSFQEILNQPLSEIEAPKAAPIGTYLGMVDGQPEFVKVGQNQTDAVNFNIKLLQAVKVDDNQLSEYLNGSPLSDKHIRHRLFLTKDSRYRVKQFLVDHLGIQFDEGKTSLGQAIPEAMGKQVILELGHRSSQDGTQIYNEVKSTAKA
jgi:hypothetical protein